METNANLIMNPDYTRAAAGQRRSSDVTVVEGMLGLGDNVYQRPVVRWLAARRGRVVLVTPWPSLYEGAPGVECAPPNGVRLRTQAANVLRDRARFRWAAAPRPASVRLSYVEHQMRGIPLWRGLCASAGMPEREYLLELDSEPLLGRGWVVLHPHTHRLEWPAPARGPDPRVWPVVVEEARRAGRRVAAAGWIQPPDEVWDGWEPADADRAWLHGELDAAELVSLHAGVDLVVTAVGFPIPLCMALGTPALVLHGGGRGASGPRMVDAPARGRLHHIEPAIPCACRSYRACKCDRRLDLELARAVVRGLLG